MNSRVEAISILKPRRLLSLWIIVIAMTTLSAPTIAAEVFPSSLQLAGNSLSKQGVGTRKKAFLSLYKAGLYLTSGSQDGAAISAADEPMAIRLEIVSGFISAKKMDSALREGFDQSTDGKVAPIQSEVDLFATGFAAEIEKKDVFDLIYQPETGVEVVKNGDSIVTVPGLAFKQALFGIWLSENPVQSSLKKAMLGSK